jgi:hypothetical protein
LRMDFKTNDRFPFRFIHICLLPPRDLRSRS